MPENETQEHLWINYGLKSDPVTGCFRCGCTPTDPTPNSVTAAVAAARIARTGE